MNDELLLRYSRQILLPQLDIWGQEKLIQARVLIVGAGGLGCPAAMYLAAAGVGHLTIADDDTVELSNLQRQIAHHTEDIGRPKAESTAATLSALNPNVKVEALCRRLEGEALAAQVAGADLVLDCSDNFATRFAVNRACVQAGRPLVSGAAIRFEGQVAVFDPRQPDSPCYHCLYPDQGELEERCSRNGVIAPVTGIVGSVQALEAIKVLAGIGRPLTGRLLILDGLQMSWHCVNLPRNPSCPTCGASS
ncbi:molybdopterin-synthase adenylyltransferase [Methylomarinovum caldicuralii]|uniref:Molybdopterin-synthase adenylyltransferase n=1 Tax=Methylomarinovum caldicuralii TaxID=438856 RepID=A0AAU9BV99_9GAMM|nr:molybdopterin-synthase adenylyltransferase MoeB [Methylomarinovum caldicuralii]BCX82908.1 molybdopterin-synthase adenylyltransferase [Methylomarinovum caldicuralii]